MKCEKEIVITAFKVQFVDIRAPRPREVQEEIYCIESDMMAAMGLLHIYAADKIRDIYEKKGYRAFSIERIAQKCVVPLDLRQLYTEQVAKQEAEAGDE